MKLMEEQLTPTPPTPIQPAPETAEKKNINWKMVLGVTGGMVVVLGIGIGIGMLVKNYQRPTAYTTASPVPTPTPDPTANWKTYTNTIGGYSIKFPSTFTTQVATMAAGHTEAGSDAISFFIYKSDSKEPANEKYLDIEIAQDEPNSQNTTQTTLNGWPAKKIVVSQLNLEGYFLQASDGKFILIYVSRDLSRKDLADQILSTFKFTN